MSVWETVNSDGPSLCFHACSVVRDSLYIHGGVSSRLSSAAVRHLWKFDFSTSKWTPVTSSGAPTCSHHAAVTQHDRYLVLIGGWNGKSRAADVHVFDCLEETWHHPRTTGFPEGAGLSSHTATSLCDGNIIVTGREGGLRTQRRAASTFRLSGDASKSESSFQYLDSSMGIASRSGHTACPMTHGRLALLGGRSDNLLEYLPVLKVPVAIDVHPKIIEKVLGLGTDLRPLYKPPGGRRNHVGVSVGEMVVIHGGETFDGRAKAAVPDVWVMDARGGGLKWLKVGGNEVARAGHVACLVRDNIFIHGGFDESGKTRNEVMKLW